MFIQIIQGTCTRQQELHEHLDRWRNELGPDAPGWLGGTYGFTDDDMFMGIVRFESRDAPVRSGDMIRVVSEPQTLGAKTFFGGIAQSRVQAAR